tara:strand:+ start:753 stop:2576 length:1824 start_codon:yes stop_codon:yes gene_type:complete
MEVPKSPYTLEGLKQSGISAFNTFRKNPIKTIMSPMVPKNPYMAAGLGLTGIYGLLPESTKKFLTEELPGGDFDMDFARREAAKAKAKQDTPKEDRSILKGILDYLPAGDFDRDFAVRESQKLTDKIVEKSPVKIKEDDVETGPEKLEKKTPDMQPKEPSIEDSNEDDNEKNTQMAVHNQKKVISDANKNFANIMDQAQKENKVQVLSSAMEAARSVMGEKGYNKSGRLLLLQLAAGLLSGKTMQPGVTGFLDVLGQAGQQVIPMAIALEREREKDEMELAKMLIKSTEKVKKISPPSLKLKYRLPNGEVSNALSASVTDEGKYLVYDNINNAPVQYVVDPASVVSMRKIEDNLTLKSKLQKEYRAIKQGEQFTKLFVNVAAENPELIGVEGGLNKIILRTGETIKIATKSKDYKDAIKKLKIDSENNFMDFKQTYGVEDGVDKRMSGIMKDIEDALPDLDDPNEKIQAQALLKTLSLLSTYSLAQVLKDKDRLAVADIDRAEKELGDIFGLIPVFDKPPLEILTSYREANKLFTGKLQGIRAEYDNQLFNVLDLDNIDQALGGAFNDKKSLKIKTFTENFDQEKTNDLETFDNLFNTDDLKGIIQK